MYDKMQIDMELREALYESPHLRTILVAKKEELKKGSGYEQD